jgi:hypothetical protein
MEGIRGSDAHVPLRQEPWPWQSPGHLIKEQSELVQPDAHSHPPKDGTVSSCCGSSTPFDAMTPGVLATACPKMGVLGNTHVPRCEQLFGQIISVQSLPAYPSGHTHIPVPRSHVLCPQHAVRQLRRIGTPQPLALHASTTVSTLSISPWDLARQTRAFLFFLCDLVHSMMNPCMGRGE